MVFLSTMDQPRTWRKEEAIFKEYGCMLRTSKAIGLGVHPRTLYALHEAGRLRRVSRGLYRLADLPELGNPDLATVAARIPQGVICLVSALAFHEITTQIPHQVDIALPRGTKQLRLDFPPRAYSVSQNRFLGLAWQHTLSMAFQSASMMRPKRWRIASGSAIASGLMWPLRGSGSSTSTRRRLSASCWTTRGCAAWNAS